MKMLSAIFAILLTADVSWAPAASNGVDERGIALAWATSHRAAAFERLLPAADSDRVSMPLCRVTTIRSAGSLDTFEYAIRITEECDSINPRTRSLVPGAMRAQLTIPQGSPITDQLARLHIAVPTRTVDAALPRIRLATIAVRDDLARRLLRRLHSSNLALIPGTSVALDARTYEIMSVTGMEKRYATLTAGAGDGTERQLASYIDRLLAALGYTEAKLAYDPSFWSRGSGLQQRRRK